MKHLYALFLIGSILSATAQSTRTVLLETSESSKTPSAASILCVKKDLSNEFSDLDKLAIISYHIDGIQYGGDPLNDEIADGWSQLFSSTFGAGSIDRVSYDGNSILTDFAQEQWADTIAARINRPTDAKVTLPEVLYDPDEDTVFVRTNIRFTDSTFGVVARDMRFFLYLVQDGFSADQAFESPRPCNIYPQFPTKIDVDYIVDSNGDTIDSLELYGAENVVHNNVPILCPTGITGTKNVIAAVIEIGNEWNDMQKFKKPDGVNLDNVRFVAFVSEFDGNNPTKNGVINVAQSNTYVTYDQNDLNDPNHPENPENPNSRLNVDNWPNGLIEQSQPEIKINVRPNPVSSLGIVEYHLPNKAEVTVDLVNIHGEMVQQVYAQELSEGRQTAAFSASELANGIYFIRVRTEQQLVHSPVVIAK